MALSQLSSLTLLLSAVISTVTGERFTFAKAHVVPGRGAWWKAAPADERHPGRHLTETVSMDQHQPPGANSAVCVVLKDEGPRLWEFGQYHSWLGFGKVYILDHNSSRPHLQFLLEQVRSTAVEYYYFSGNHRPPNGPENPYWTSAQGFGYEFCMRLGLGRHKWMAFLDSDEYIVLRGVPEGTKPDINTFLTEYEGFGALGVNWRTFGTSGFIQPVHSVLANYMKCTSEEFKLNMHVKSIVQLSKVRGLGGDPHHFQLKDGEQTVSELKTPFSGPFNGPSFSRIAIYHYKTRSVSEFLRKVARGRGSAAGKNVGLSTSLTSVQRLDAAATSECTEGPGLWKQCCEAQHTAWIAGGGGGGHGGGAGGHGGGGGLH